MCKGKKNDDKNEKGDDSMNSVIERPNTILESVKKSLKEIKLIREGKLPRKTWKQLKNECKNTDEKGE